MGLGDSTQPPNINAFAGRFGLIQSRPEASNIKVPRQTGFLPSGQNGDGPVGPLQKIMHFMTHAKTHVPIAIIEAKKAAIPNGGKIKNKKSATANTAVTIRQTQDDCAIHSTAQFSFILAPEKNQDLCVDVQKISKPALSPLRLVQS